MDYRDYRLQAGNARGNNKQETHVWGQSVLTYCFSHVPFFSCVSVLFWEIGHIIVLKVQSCNGF